MPLGFPLRGPGSAGRSWSLPGSLSRLADLHVRCTPHLGYPRIPVDRSWPRRVSMGLSKIRFPVSLEACFGFVCPLFAWATSKAPKNISLKTNPSQTQPLEPLPKSAKFLGHRSKCTSLNSEQCLLVPLVRMLVGWVWFPFGLGLD